MGRMLRVCLKILSCVVKKSEIISRKTKVLCGMMEIWKTGKSLQQSKIPIFQMLSSKFGAQLSVL